MELELHDINVILTEFQSNDLILLPNSNCLNLRTPSSEIFNSRSRNRHFENLQKNLTYRQIVTSVGATETLRVARFLNIHKIYIKFFKIKLYSDDLKLQMF